MSFRYFLIVALFFISPVSYAQLKTDINIGKVDSLQSAILKEKRKIWVFLPRKGKSLVKFPVLYLLDGDHNFHSVTGIIHQLSKVGGEAVLPEMIVVAIVNTDRTRDLTPSKSKENYQFFKNSGGGIKFTEFLQKELIPFIEKKYPALPHRTLVGHSLGGLMAINTLLDYPQLFNNYIAIDPTLTWDDQMILKKADQQLKTKKLNNKRLFLTLANTLNSSGDTSNVRKDTSIITYHVRSVLQFTDKLKSDKTSGLTWSYAYFKEDTHSSVPLISAYHGLRYVFNYFPAPPFEKFLDRNHPLDVDSLLTVHYANVSKNLGYKTVPEEHAINYMGYNFLEEGYLPSAFSCFTFYLRNYPKSYRAYNGMGDYYRRIKDTTKAVHFYSKALSIQENAFSREKLLELLKKGE